MRIANAVNCYSASEDTLGNAGLNEWLSGKMYRRKFWAIQEVLKGTEYIDFAPNSWGLNKEGGWGYNPYYETNNWGYVTWPNRRMTILFRNRIARMTRDDIVRHPVFCPFDEDWLFTTNAISPAAVAPIRARILAGGRKCELDFHHVKQCLCRPGRERIAVRCTQGRILLPFLMAARRSTPSTLTRSLSCVIALWPPECRLRA